MPRSRAGLAIRFAQSLGRGNQAVAKVRSGPTRGDGSHAAHGEGHAIARGRLIPLVEGQDRGPLAIEGDDRDMVRDSSGAEDRFRAGLGGGPQSGPAHARTAVEQDHDPFRLGGRGIVQLSLREEGPRETQRQQQERQAAQDQEEDVLKPMPLRNPRRTRQQKHQRTEDCPFPGRLPD